MESTVSEQDKEKLRLLTELVEVIQKKKEETITEKLVHEMIETSTQKFNLVVDLTKILVTALNNEFGSKSTTALLQSSSEVKKSWEGLASTLEEISKKVHLFLKLVEKPQHE